MAERVGTAECAGDRGGSRRDVARPTDPAAQPLLRIEDVSKRFGDFAALDQLSLDIRAGEFFALLGPSGCGKTTLLRLIAGFETPSAGRLLLDGNDLVPVPPYRRPINMMFQSYALFPHLTVERNIGFGLRQEGLPRRTIDARVAEMLALVRLERFARRRPDQLSGGERQRVALARSLAKRPRVLLLDEPLAALDRKLREETRFELVALQKRLGTTFVIVTHDQDEAMAMADRIAVMSRGRLAQIGTAAEIYERPRSRFVAEFVGDVNLIAGRVTASAPSASVIEGSAGRLRTVQPIEAAPGTEVLVALRPEKLKVAAEPPPQAAENAVAGTVSDIAYLGNMSIYKVRLDDGTPMKAALVNATPVERPILIGERVWLSWAADAGVVLAA